MQVYIVTGGKVRSYLSSTETLEKDGGSAWQEVASLPSGRGYLQGVGLDNGRFIVTGQSVSVFRNLNIFSLVVLIFALFWYRQKVSLQNVAFLPCPGPINNTNGKL